MTQPENRGGKASILAIGFNVPRTGLTRVMHSILRPLGDRYDIHFIGIGYKGPVLHEEITLYPCNLKGGDIYGMFQAKALIGKLRPRLVFLLNDLWILKGYMRVLADFKDRLKIVTYCALDGQIIDDTDVAALHPVDRFVVYTEFARREIAQSVRRLQQVDESFTFGGLDVIGHGVDTEVFYPLPGSVEGQFVGEKRRKARQAVFPDEPALWDAFLVLNANRPNPRKRIDLTIEAFARFARDKPPHVRLYLHHAIMNERERDDILALAQRHGIQDRLTLTPITAEAAFVDDAHLNLVYNACDVGINTATGEGWGLISFEHAAAGAAQIVPRHSACTELWDGAAMLLEPARRYTPRYTPLALAEVDPKEAVAALETLYQDADYLRAMSEAAYRNATQPHYQWTHLAHQWDRLFSELL